MAVHIVVRGRKVLQAFYNAYAVAFRVLRDSFSNLLQRCLKVNERGKMMHPQKHRQVSSEVVLGSEHAQNNQDLTERWEAAGA